MRFSFMDSHKMLIVSFLSAVIFLSICMMFFAIIQVNLDTEFHELGHHAFLSPDNVVRVCQSGSTAWTNILQYHLFLILLFGSLRKLILWPLFSVDIQGTTLLHLTFECMYRKGLWTTSLSTLTKAWAVYNAWIPSEILIAYTLCCAFVFNF